MLTWSIGILSFLILTLTLHASVYIFRSIWFRFWASRKMSNLEKRILYVHGSYDVKWSISLIVMLVLCFVLFQLIGFKVQSWWSILCAFLFGLLLWGNYRTLNTEKERLKKQVLLFREEE